MPYVRSENEMPRAPRPPRKFDHKEG